MLNNFFVWMPGVPAVWNAMKAPDRRKGRKTRDRGLWGTTFRVGKRAQQNFREFWSQWRKHVMRAMVSESNDRDEIVRFRLYVASNAPNSVPALGNLRVFCETYLKGRYEIEIVDVLRDDVAGLEDGIVATPTLLKVAPAPHQMFVGTLNDWNALAELCGIDRKSATWNQVWEPSLEPLAGAVACERTMVASSEKLVSPLGPTEEIL